jgi:uncharacterized membrane protein SpoIIM required for sporulation
MQESREVQRFVRRRQEGWDRLERHLGDYERRGRLLNPEEALDAARQYRSACADLAWLNSRHPSAAVREPLNALVSRAHLLLTPLPEARPVTLARLYIDIVPQAVRRQWRTILAVSLSFAFVAIYGWTVALNDPSRLQYWVPDFVREKFDEGEMWTRAILPNAPLFSSLIIVNNLVVSMLAVASGVTFGLLTLELMLSNALMLGGIAALAYHSGIKTEFFGFIAGHGPTEMSAIMICLAAGFLIPIGFLRPGDLPRMESLRRSARDSAYLLVAAIPMILAAGFVEAFISPNMRIPPALRAGIGLVLLGLFAMYFTVMPIQTQKAR